MGARIVASNEVELKLWEVGPGSENWAADVFRSAADVEKPLVCGISDIRPAEEEVISDFDHDEMKFQISGQTRVRDRDTGEELMMKPGDIAHFSTGSHLAFSSPEGSLAFYVGGRDWVLPEVIEERAEG